MKIVTNYSSARLDWLDQIIKKPFKLTRKKNLTNENNVCFWNKTGNNPSEQNIRITG